MNREGLPEMFNNVPEDIIRIVEERIFLVSERSPEGTSDYHIAMYVACQFAYDIATSGTK